MLNQSVQDELLEYYTEGMAEYAITLFPPDFKGIMVDVGAFDPVWLSNSWLFKQAGWGVHCIEANPHCIPYLLQHHKYVYEYACGDRNEDDVNFYIWATPGLAPKHRLINRDGAMVGEAGATSLILHEKASPPSESVKVKLRTLDWLIINELKIDHVDLLSIDVEMSEMSVLRGADLARWKPSVIIIENIYEGQDQHIHLDNLGYNFVNRIVVNDFYKLGGT